MDIIFYDHESLEIFFQEANNFHTSIRFIAEISNEQHVYLDTKSRLAESEIDVHKAYRHASIRSTLKLSSETLQQKIVWLSLSGEYAQILNLNLGQ